MTTVRRTFLKNTTAIAMATALPALSFAQAAPRRLFAPQSGAWRTFDVTTRVDLVKPQGVAKVWLPIPSVNSDYQRSQGNSFSSNGKTDLTDDGVDGAKMLYAEFAAGQAQPFVELTSRVQTQGRAVDWSQKNRGARRCRHAALLHASDEVPADRRHRPCDGAESHRRRKNRR
jgi:hypothetical protein